MLLLLFQRPENKCRINSYEYPPETGGECSRRRTREKARILRGQEIKREDGAEAGKRDLEESAQETYLSSSGPACFSRFFSFYYGQYSLFEQTSQGDPRSRQGGGGGASQADRLAKGYRKQSI